MTDPPKLYTNKPKKGAQAKNQQKTKEFTSPPLIETHPPASSSSAAAAATPPQPQPPKQSFARRYKFVWPLLLTVNLAVGAYLFFRTKKKEPAIEGEEVAVVVPSAPIVDANTSALVPEIRSPVLFIPEPVKVHKPIPEDQQRELFKWALEEKRKVKPKDPEEKKRIDEEKSILKQFIQAKSIPNI